MLSRAAGVIETNLEHELVLLDPESQAMFSLNATGRRIWDALPVDDEARLVDAVVNEYDVSREQAERDVTRLVRELVEAGLIEYRSHAGED